MRGQISLWDSALNSFEYIPRGGITGSHSNSTLNFWGTSIQSSTLAVPFYITNSARVSISPPTKVLIFTNICYFLFFFLIGVHPNRRDVSHCGFDLHFPKAMVFPVVMYGCQSWTVKKAERRRIDALNCGVGEDSWESLGLQGDPTSPFWRRSTLGFLWKEWG